MEAKTKQYILVTAVGVSLFAALMNFSTVLDFAGKVMEPLLPVLVGGVLALFFHVPMNGIEKRLKRLFAKSKKPPSGKLICVLSFFLTLACIALVVVLALTLLIPELARSCRSLYAQIEANIPRWSAYMKDAGAELDWLREWLAGINWEQFVSSLSDGLDSFLGSAVNAVSSTVNGVVTAAFALILSVYMTLGREELGRHAGKLIRAYLRPAQAGGLLKFCGMFRQSFANFLTGQCSEAVILGALMASAFAVFRIPYGSLVGVLTAICAIIPYIGAFISCFVSVLLVLLADPTLALRSLIVYLAVQFIENQFIYPRVVGSSVGLSPLYTLIAAMIGGKLFGIVGILFFIPLAAVVIELVKEDAAGRLNSRRRAENSPSAGQRQ